MTDRGAGLRLVSWNVDNLAPWLAITDGPAPLAGDWNVSRAAIDTHPRPPHQLDAARVDYILISADLAPSLLASEILGAPTGSRSDHVPVAVSLSLSRFHTG